MLRCLILFGSIYLAVQYHFVDILLSTLYIRDRTNKAIMLTGWVMKFLMHFITLYSLKRYRNFLSKRITFLEIYSDYYFTQDVFQNYWLFFHRKILLFLTNTLFSVPDVCFTDLSKTCALINVFYYLSAWYPLSVFWFGYYNWFHWR